MIQKISVTYTISNPRHINLAPYLKPTPYQAQIYQYGNKKTYC
ncbi:hypothetical protein [Helicobacter sp. T3_23-1059]